MLRIVSGVAAGTIVVLLFLTSRIAGLTIIAVFHFLAILEYFRIIEPPLPAGLRMSALAVLNLSFLTAIGLILTYKENGDFLFGRFGSSGSAYLYLVASCFIMVVLTWIVLFAVVAFGLVTRHPDSGFPLSSALYTVFSAIYIFLGLGSLALLFGAGQPGAWFAAFILSWGADTGAFFTGKTLGRNLLCPRVSPKKTVEGFIGCILTGAIALPVFLYFLPQFQPLSFAAGIGYAIIGACIAALGHLGDLFTSVIKRTYDRKDSGKFLPGHGGFLDRLDSLLIVSPIVAILFLSQLKL